jgi:signal transduction histidine kinase/ligand-binding sensor domain-containing protein
LLWNTNPISNRAIAVLIAGALGWISAPALGGQTVSPNLLFGKYRQFVWNETNGLPDNSILSIAQSREGYLWFATSDGVVRFDGVSFTLFGAKSLKQDWSATQSVLLARDGSLWFAIRSHGLTRYKDGVFTPFRPRSKASYITEQLLEDHDGNLWIATSGSGLLRIREGKTTVWAMEEGLPANAVVSLAEDPNGTLWVGTPRGLAMLRGGRVVRVFTKRDGMPADSVTALCVDRNGVVWIGADDGSITTLTSGAFHLVSRKTHFRVNSLYCDRGNRIWAGRSDSSLALFENGRASHDAAANVLPPGGIDAIFQDADGAIWLGTYGGGLSQLRETAVAAYGVRPEFKDLSIGPVIQDRAGAMWFGSSGGWLRLKDEEVSRPLPMRDVNCDGVAEDTAGQLWFATSTGIARWRDGRLARIPPRLFLDKGISSLYGDRAGNLWLGTRDHGVCVYRDGHCTNYNTSNGLGHNFIVGFFEDRDGAVWIATLNGASRVWKGQVRTWTTADGLASNVIACFYQTSNGDIWIGTQGGGLSRFRNGSFANVTTDNGLFDNLAFQIIEDDSANLWMSCNHGIYRVSLRALNDCADGRTRVVTSYSYGVSDGMLTNDCDGAFPAGWKSRDGRIWFGTPNGPVAIDPRVATSGAPANVRIEEASVDGRELAGREIRIGPGQHTLEIRYTALSWKRPRQIRFRVKLDGLDDNWADVGFRRSAYYSRLPAGNYVFRAVADNGDGLWTGSGDSIAIAVAAPWFATSWFYLLCGVTAIGIVSAAWRVRVAHLLRAREAQQKFLQLLIGSQEAERKRLAGELHDGLAQRLTIMKNLALQHLNAPAYSEDKDANLTMLCDEISGALKEVRTISYALRPYQLDYLGLKEALQALVKTVSAASTTIFSSRFDDINDLFPKDAEINVYRIVQECLNNIVKHSQARHAEVSVSHDGSRVYLEIADDGVGFSLSGPRSDERKAGLGLTSISERVQLLGGSIQVESSLGKGTNIHIRLPVSEPDR